MGIPVLDGDGDGIEFFSPSGMGPGMGMDIEIGDGDGKHDTRNSLTHCHPYTPHHIHHASTIITPVTTDAARTPPPHQHHHHRHLVIVIIIITPSSSSPPPAVTNSKELLRARPTTLGEALFLARIIEARLEAITEKEKEQIIKKKAYTILSLRSELASPEIKGSLDVMKIICTIHRGIRDALSKLLQMGTVAEYQSEFEILINRVTGISQSLLKSFYISGLKLTLQIELLRARPTTLGEAFYLARIIEARLKAIAEKEKEHIIKKKADTILSLRSELASPDIKGSLDGDEDIGVDEVSSAIDGVFDIGKSLVVFLKWVQISGSRPLLLMVSLENTDVAMGKEVKIQRRIWDPGIKIFFRQHLEDKVILKGWGVIRLWLMRDGFPDMACWITIVVYLLCFIRISVGVIV
ncbi:hypothetical protein Tco_0333625 [Tanacetum coccineum]